MCGIAGIIGDGEESTDALVAMTRALAHRGPDAEKFWHDHTAGIHLGHRRLSILDHAGGAQPMQTADGRLTIVFNGEIYNHHELRETLTHAGHIFRSDHSDTEVLLHGYREWGEGLSERLRGMWALAIYDAARHEVFLSRDRFGKKPLYYHHTRERFIFASELSALQQHPLVPREISPLALRKYFAYGSIPAPLSLYQNIAKLPPAHHLTLDTRSFSATAKSYWTFQIEPENTETPQPSEDELCEELLSLLTNAVRRRLEADVPVGIFLSGGIDSSAVAAITANIQGADAVSTFSIGFSDSAFDESAYARRMANILGTHHYAKIFSPDELPVTIPDLVARLDEPFGDSSLLPTYLVCKTARERVTVALGGDGADELFAGYDPFRALRYARHYHKFMPRPLHAGLVSLAALLPVRHSYMTLGFRVNRFLRGLNHAPRLWNPTWLAPLNPAELSELFAMPCDPEEIYSEAIDIWESSRSENLVDRTLEFYTRIFLPDNILMKTDRASMMNGLEVRSPFLDNEVVDFARRLPWRYKLRGNTTKYILKRALSRLLPEEIITRKKQGFAMPIGQWLQDGRLGIESSRTPGIHHPAAQRLLTEHQNSAADHRLFLYNYWLLERHLAKTPLSPK